jgi:hypothetical protein
MNHLLTRLLCRLGLHDWDYSGNAHTLAPAPIRCTRPHCRRIYGGQAGRPVPYSIRCRFVWKSQSLGYVRCWRRQGHTDRHVASARGDVYVAATPIAEERFGFWLAEERR